MANVGLRIALTVRLHNTFNLPLPQRCSEVAKLLEEASIKEWYSGLPLLLESLFGFTDGQPGWGLSLLCRQRHHEYEHVHALLSTNGPLLKLIGRMLAEPYFRFEFPVGCIPFSSQRMIEESGVPQLYTDKLQFNQAGKPYAMLSLNAFEYYFFHFAYMLVNPQGQKYSDLWSSAVDTLYPALLDDYFNYFLPTYPTPTTNRDAMTPAMTVNWTPPSQSPVVRQRSSGTSGGGVCGSPVRLSPRSLMRSPSHRSPHAHSTAMAMLLESNGEQETWRSCTFMQILVEFWLNQTSLDSDRYLSPSNSSSLRGFTCHWMTVNDPARYIALESFLPSLDHMRVVRMLVKHVHYYVNSAMHPSAVPSPYSPMPMTSREDDFKRSLLSQVVQKKMYAFLRHCFERWPLDSSFKLVMETWLSYIQPWRYVDPAMASHDVEARNKHINATWRPFITDNLLFYTVLCCQFIRRSFRIDLTSAKNASMLYRMSKVFSLPNLRELIQDVERSVDEPRLPSGTLGRTDPGAGCSYLPGVGGSPYGGRTLTPLLGLQLAELEKPGFRYQPLFRHDMQQLVQQLLQLTIQARDTALCRSRHQKHRNVGVWAWLFGAANDYNTAAYPTSHGQPDDPERVDVHLTQAVNNLATLFSVEVPMSVASEGKSAGLGDSGSAGGGSSCDDLSPDVEMSEDGQPRLTDLGRCQLAKGLRKFDIIYSGDPELQPIRSFESAFLVRALYSLATYINEKFSPQFTAWSRRSDLPARVACQFLSLPPTNPPTATCKSCPPALRHSKHPPRVQLRWLASYQTIGYVLALYVIAYLWLGTGFVGFSLIIGLVALCYGLVRATVGGRSRR